MLNPKKYHILFVICHPDDEAIWIGGLISELSKIRNFEIDVICISGNDKNSPRIKEFKKAKKISGYHRGVILGEKLRPATKPLPDIAVTLLQGLKEIHLHIANVDLLITHSPYGDEHRHPHHMQAFKELSKWTKENKVPFGFFSSIPTPWFNLRPILENMKIINNLHLLNFAICSKFKKTSFQIPKYFLQFLTLNNSKQKMINCYKSANLKEIKQGYISYSSNSELIYLFDDSGLKPFKFLIGKMHTPGSKYLFSYFKNTSYNVASILKQKVGI